jgi:hypothetical protein
MPSGRDSFRRNRVAPVGSLYFSTFETDAGTHVSNLLHPKV